MKVPGYLRHVDDLFLFADRRGDLERWRRELVAWLDRKRSLRLKHPDTRVLSCRSHLDALGYRVRRDGLIALPRALRRLRHRLAREPDRPPWHHPEVDLERSVASTASVVLFGP